jgi:P-type E1-E2 ATPase
VGGEYTKNRALLEKDMKFLGLVFFENALKPETKPTILKLNKAKIQSLIVTGDNLMTAVSVAYNCSIIDVK